MGTPVVIADNGLGVPVQPVESGAPVLTVAENGLGVPIVISDKGVPFILDGYHPVPPPVVMTAGQDAEGTSTGFSDGTVIEESFGSLSAEPVDGFPVVALATSAASLVVALDGDATGVVGGMTLWIDGVEYEPTTDWSYNGSITIYVVAPPPFLFVDGNTYEVEIKAPPVSPFSPATVTAGVSEFGDTGYYRTVYGGISSEPLAGHPVLELATRNSGYTQVAFTGDCVSTVEGWRPVIDGVTITGVISAWAFDGEYTSATWDSSGSMVEAQTYPITWTME